MFVTFTVTPPGGSPFALNDESFPANLVDTHCEMSDRPRTPKQSQPGQYPVYTFARNRIWHIEGDILGTDMADYDTKRIALLNSGILPLAVPTTRYTSTITVTAETGDTFTSIVTLTSYSIPVAALYPGVGTYMFEWESDDPFVYDLSNDPGYI